ncbi:PREDICTED: putative clathrin assembly protein At1g14686 [Camelina sativa]|uniref:Clathrin assembly protein At1g14686 n=1 Tax=Camelina sativa TaxID=90675 RepID=A0ABM0WUX3_CAMSA|nr:PREDICTED: putative clathrin assembly protein At1g14686 [Camelina sativa]
MKLWNRGAVVIKDGPSLFAADDILTAAVVKATSHDELSIDTESAQFIYRHVLASPSSLKPLISIISSRVSRTRSWAVALKGLMLMHGFFLCKTTVAESIGRLPFDLSSFGQGSSRIMSKTGGFSLFVRAYFAFLDRRSILFHDGSRHRYDEESSVMIRLVIIRKMQVIVDSLIRIKPIGENMNIPLIDEAMENVVSEILEIYGWICRRIAEVLPNVHSKIRKTEADLALKIVTKSMVQSKELVKYFEFCRDLGVSNAQKVPDFVTIPEADVLHLDELVRSQVKEEATETDSCEEDAEIVEEEEEGETKLTLYDLITLDQNDEEAPVSPPPPPPPRVVDIPDLISF